MDGPQQEPANFAVSGQHLGVKIEAVAPDFFVLARALREYADMIEDKLPGYQVRVYRERTELAEKLTKLNTYIWANTKPEEDDDRPAPNLSALREQASYMAQYLAILDRRIAGFIDGMSPP